MKAEVTQNPPAYISKTVTITFESYEEEIGFRHLCTCGPNDSCDSRVQVESARNKLNNLLSRKLCI